MKWLEIFRRELKKAKQENENKYCYEELTDDLIASGEPHWQVDGWKVQFDELFRALRGWLPAGSVLYFESGYPDKEIEDFLNQHPIPKDDKKKIRLGTYGRPRIAHAPGTDTVLGELARIMDHHAGPELAVHFHVYKRDRVLLQWYDAGDDPILLSESFSEQQVKVLADRVGTKYEKTA